MRVCSFGECVACTCTKARRRLIIGQPVVFAYKIEAVETLNRGLIHFGSYYLNESTYLYTTLAYKVTFYNICIGAYDIMLFYARTTHLYIIIII